MENGRKLYYPGRFPVIMGENFSLSSNVRKRLGKRAGVPGLDIIQAFLQETVEFKASDKLFIGFDAEDGKVSLPVLCNKYGLAILVAEGRYFVITVAEICTGFDGGHSVHLLER